MENVDYYLEPFCGSCAVIEKISGIRRFASDKNEYLIELYKSLQNGWIPPKTVSEEEYRQVKENKEENKSLTAFVGIGCSFSGKWFGGYARNKRLRNYAMDAHNTLLKQLPLIIDIDFSYRDYLEYNPKNALIYCDPPYANSTKYGLFNGKFDHESFWKTMEKWSENNVVFISEYVAPEEFKCVLEIPTRTDIRNKNNELIPRIEKLFTYNKTKIL